MVGIRVWVCRPSEQERSADQVLLSPAEIERMSRYVQEADRDRFSSAWALARRVLGDMVGTDPHRLSFNRQCALCGDEKHGKPQLLDAPLDFSIAHADDRVLLAVSEQAQVGVDVERVDAPVADIAESVLHPTETSVDQADMVRIWVRKEAVLKTTGHGLARRMTDFSVLAAPAGMFLADLPAGEDYVAAVAAVSQEEPSVAVVPDTRSR